MSSVGTLAPRVPTARAAGKRPRRIVAFRPTIQRNHMHAVLECMVADQVGAADRAAALTTALAQQFGAAGGVALSDQAAGIAAAYAAAGLVHGSRLLLSALAPAIFVQIAEQRGILPVLADVDPNTGGMRLDEVRRYLEIEPQAVLLTHSGGGRDDPELVSGLDIPVIEDVSGRWRDGAQLLVADEEGNTTAADATAVDATVHPATAAFGDVLLVSLAERNLITAGGGIVVLGRNRRRQRAIATAVQMQAASSLPDMNAALALAQLEDLDTFINLRSRQAEMFAAALLPTKHATFGGTAAGAPLAFPVVVHAGLKEVRRYAAKHGIETVPAYAACALECYRQTGELGDAAETDAGAATEHADAGLQPEDVPDLPDVLLRQLSAAKREPPQSWPAAQALARQCLLFPLYPSLPEEAVQRVAEVLATLP